MTRKKKRGRRALHPLDALGGESRRDRKKEAQLCAQVREALSLALADVEDDLVLSLFVLDVVPAPNSSRLAVRLEAEPDADVEAIHVRLDALAGRFRSEVASAIHRKKTPTLVFEIMPRSVRLPSP